MPVQGSAVANTQQYAVQPAHNFSSHAASMNATNQQQPPPGFQLSSGVGMTGRPPGHVYPVPRTTQVNVHIEYISRGKFVKS